MACILALAGVAVLGGSFTWFAFCDMLDDKPFMLEAVRQHFAAVVGLPAAALAAFCLVLLLEAKSGPIEFEGVGFKFKGASGELVLWIFSFLAIASGIKLLW